MNAKPCFWKAMAEGWGGDLWKERNGLLGEKKNPPKAREADFGRWKSRLSLGKENPPNAREEDFHGDRSVMFGEKKIPSKARETDFGRWRSGLSLGKEKPPNAREEDFHGGRSGLLGEKERGDLGKSSFRAENAARCMCRRSTLHRLAQRAASAIAPHCVSRLTLLLLVPRRHRLLRQAPLSSPARAPGIIGRGSKEEAPSCSFPVRKVQEGALLYPVTLHSSAHLSLRKRAAWSGHSV